MPAKRALISGRIAFLFMAALLLAAMPASARLSYDLSNEERARINKLMDNPASFDGMVESLALIQGVASPGFESIVNRVLAKGEADASEKSELTTAIVTGLKHHNPFVRVGSARLLWWAGGEPGPEITQALLSLLRETDEEVRCAAMTGLRNNSAPAAATALRAIFLDERETMVVRDAALFELNLSKKWDTRVSKILQKVERGGCGERFKQILKRYNTPIPPSVP